MRQLVHTVQIEVLSSDADTATIAVYLNQTLEPEVFQLSNRAAHRKGSPLSKINVRGDVIQFALQEFPRKLGRELDAK